MPSQRLDSRNYRLLNIFWHQWKRTLKSAALFFLVYAILMGSSISLGLVVLLFIHEMGHYMMAQKLKIGVARPIFIPFMGAVIKVRTTEKLTAEDEAALAIAGPVVGGLGCLIFLLVYYAFFPENPTFKKVIALGIFINAMNLLPIRPLDGGRVLQVFGPNSRYVGLPLLAGLIYFLFPSPFILLLLWVTWKNFNSPFMPASNASKAKWLLIYMLTLFGLGILFVLL